MSFGVVAMVAASVISSAIKSRQAKKAAKKQARAAEKAQAQARLDAKKDKDDARAAEVYAETEGQGTAKMGRVSLELDDRIDPTEKKIRSGSSLRI